MSQIAPTTQLRHDVSNCAMMPQIASFDSSWCPQLRHGIPNCAITPWCLELRHDVPDCAIWFVMMSQIAPLRQIAPFRQILILTPRLRHSIRHDVPNCAMTSQLRHDAPNCAMMPQIASFNSPWCPELRHDIPNCAIAPFRQIFILTPRLRHSIRHDVPNCAIHITPLPKIAPMPKMFQMLNSSLRHDAQNCAMPNLRKWLFDHFDHFDWNRGYSIVNVPRFFLDYSYSLNLEFTNPIKV